MPAGASAGRANPHAHWAVAEPLQGSKGGGKGVGIDARRALEEVGEGSVIQGGGNFQPLQSRAQGIGRRPPPQLRSDDGTGGTLMRRVQGTGRPTDPVYFPQTRLQPAGYPVCIGHLLPRDVPCVRR